jgi:hypothetical protein
MARANRTLSFIYIAIELTIALALAAVVGSIIARGLA